MLKKWGLALMLMNGLAQAQSTSPVLDNIRKTGEIILGHGEMTVPFTYILPDENIPRGFSHDIQLVIVEHLKKKLNLPELKVKYQQVGYDDLFDLVSSGKVQLYCGTTTNTEERQKQFNFSYAFFVATTRLMAKKDSGIQSYKDLKGLQVGSMADSTALHFINARRNQYGIAKIKVYDREDAVVEDLNLGEIQAFFMSDAILAGVISQLEHPEDWVLVGKAATSERFGCFTNPDAQLKELMNEALMDFYHSGYVYAVYDKWFKQPVPPYHKTVGFEMSDALKQIYQLPSDKAIGQN